MPFAYYVRLSAAQKAVYRRSDAIHAVPLPDHVALRPVVDELRDGLARDDRRAVAAAATRLANGIATTLRAPPITVQVLEVRPKNPREELQGLYTLSDEGRARIRVWMRTAERGRVVAFRTFLRTLLHEMCHHLDFTKLGLDPSFHTEGFYQRESSLFHQLVPDPPPAT